MKKRSKQYNRTGFIVFDWKGQINTCGQEKTAGGIIRMPMAMSAIPLATGYIEEGRKQPSLVHTSLRFWGYMDIVFLISHTLGQGQAPRQGKFVLSAIGEKYLIFYFHHSFKIRYLRGEQIYPGRHPIKKTTDVFYFA